MCVPRCFEERHVPEIEAPETVGLCQTIAANRVDGIGYVDGLGLCRSVGVPGVDQGQCFVQFGERFARIADVVFDAAQSLPDRWRFAAAAPVFLSAIGEMEFAVLRIDGQEAMHEYRAVDVLAIETELATEEVGHFLQGGMAQVIGE